MELFKKENKDLIVAKNFIDDDKEKYFYIKKENQNDKEARIIEYFIIPKDDFSKLYYYNGNGKKLLVRGLEENDLTANESTKFYFTGNEEIQPEKYKELFIEEIKFNLLSNKTIIRRE